MLEEQIEQIRDDNLDLRFALSAEFRNQESGQLDPAKGKEIVKKLKKMGLITNVADLRETNMRLQTILNSKEFKDGQDNDKPVNLEVIGEDDDGFAFDN